MPKVGTVRLIHKNSGKVLFVDVKFFTKSKLFQIDGMPQEICDWYGSKKTKENKYSSRLHSGEITAKSYEEVESLAQKLYDEFYDMEINEEKLIAYKLKYNLPNQEGLSFNHTNQINFGPSLCIGMEYTVLYRFEIGGEKFISTGTYEQCIMPKDAIRMGGHKMKREDTDRDYYDFEKTPYSDDLHEFFKNTKSALTALILNVKGFFGEGSEKLLENVRSGRNMISPPPSR